jgi:SAM-dependent methyltransferase
VETNQGAVEIGRRAGLNIFRGTLEAANYPDHHFDAVTLWDVLEHLPDPAGSLAEIHRVLQPDGVVIIRVPNHASWEARIFGRFWAGLDAPRHLFVFDIESLQKMLVKSGFSPGRRAGSVGLYPAFLLSIQFWMLGHPGRAARLQAVMKLLENPVTRLLAAPWFYGIGKTRWAAWVVLAASKHKADFEG